MIERSVYMHITGRIIDESHQPINTLNKCVRIGKQITLFQHMTMVANYSTIAAILMAGKNKNIIQNSLSHVNANMVKHVPNHIVHIGILIRTRNFL